MDADVYLQTSFSLKDHLLALSPIRERLMQFFKMRFADLYNKNDLI